ncbi:hypothetical protein, partial [Mycobacterium tuberculosis]|uniref:hypothetical protein n=1 Tax=Mycobacterium tuberculosis TaxID=1773 RepID=UPI0012603530
VDRQRDVNQLWPAASPTSRGLAGEARPHVVTLDSSDASRAAVRLQIDQPGRLDALNVHEVKRGRPKGDQAEVRVVAAGLNFSEVVKAMGVYAGLVGDAPVIGGECVGHLTAQVPQSRVAG